MIGSMRAMIALRPETMKRLAAVSTAGMFTLAMQQSALQGGQSHGHDHGHHQPAQVANQVSDPIVLQEKPEESRSKRSKLWATSTFLTAIYGYALAKIYQKFSKNAAKEFRPWVFGACLGVIAGCSVVLAFNAGANMVVREIAINRDLRTMSVRTGLSNDSIHTIDIKEIRPLQGGRYEGFKAPLESGKMQTFYLPDESRLEGQGYFLTNTQLYHDLITGNHEAIRKYTFKN